MKNISQLRIGIDCRLAGLDHGGIGRYIQNILTELLTEHSNRVHFVLYFYDQKQFSKVKQYLPKKKLEFVDIVFAKVRHYSLVEQLRMPNFFYSANLDLLHVPHFNLPLFYSGKTVLTIHDLLWHEFKGVHVTTLPFWQYSLKHWIYLKVVSRAIKKAKCIFVPTRTVAETIHHYYPTAKRNIVVTSEGVDQNFLSKIPNRKKPVKDLIYVGSLYPHKNISVVLRALTKDPTLKLDIVGSRNVFQDNIRTFIHELKIDQRVRFLGQLDDDKLASILSEYTALVQPSLSEGFGLTGLEAMAAHTTVIAADIPVFHEVYQNAAVFFDPKSSTDFLHKYRQLSENRALYLDLSKSIVKKYSWQKTTQIIFNQYLQVIKNQ